MFAGALRSRGGFAAFDVLRKSPTSVDLSLDFVVIFRLPV